jgi:hypothetical protein
VRDRQLAHLLFLGERLNVEVQVIPAPRCRSRVARYCAG